MVIACNAPCPGTEACCQREQGHAGECFSKYKAIYAGGVTSFGTMWWVGPNNLPKQKEENGSADQ